LYLPLALAAMAAAGCGQPSKAVNLLDEAHVKKWQLTPTFAAADPWTLTDDAFHGRDSWVAYPETYEDFVLECDILFDGKGEGGIVIRGDGESDEPWQSGYELDIDWAPDREHGHIHFPIKPKPYIGDALIDVEKWHHVTIRAEGRRVKVFLDGAQVLQFDDDEFTGGQICLEGRPGGVAYRNLRIRPL
jgi:hypothetical protein